MKKWLPFALVPLMATGCFEKSAEYQEVDKDADLISKNAINLNTTYLYVPSTSAAPRYAISQFPFYQGEEKLVQLHFSKKGLEVLELDRDAELNDKGMIVPGRYVTDNEASVKYSPVLTIPGEHIDFRCNEDEFGECTNSEEVIPGDDDGEETWKGFAYFDPEYKGIIQHELNTTNWFFEGGGLDLTETKVISYEVKDGVIDIELEKTFQVQESAIFDHYNNGLSDLSFKSRFHYSLVDINKLASKDYTPVYYADTDHDTFGFFKDEINKYNVNGTCYNDCKVSHLLNRFNPTKETLDYHLSGTFLKPENKIFLDATEEVFQAINPMMQAAGVPPVKLITPESVETARNSGDLRINMINLVDDPLENGLLGYGPSVSHPLTGEIVKAHINQYSGVARTITRRHWNELVRLFNRDAIAKTPAIVAERSTSLIGESQADTDPQSTERALLLPVTNGISQIDRATVEKAKQASRRQVHIDDLQVIEKNRDVTSKEFNFNNELLVEEKRLLQWGEQTALGVEASWVSSTVKGFLPGLDENDSRWNVEGKLIAWDNLSDEAQRIISDAVAVYVYKTTLVHELGHNLGLRHNFKGSLDGNNFYSEAEVNELNLKHVPAYSSVMDYAPSVLDELPVWGKYDLAAFRFAYKRELDLVAENTADVENQQLTFSLDAYDTIYNAEIKNSDGDNSQDGSLKLPYGVVDFIENINALKDESDRDVKNATSEMLAAQAKADSYREITQRVLSLNNAEYYRDENENSQAEQYGIIDAETALINDRIEQLKADDLTDEDRSRLTAEIDQARDNIAASQKMIGDLEAAHIALENAVASARDLYAQVFLNNRQFIVENFALQLDSYLDHYDLAEDEAEKLQASLASLDETDTRYFSSEELIKHQETIQTQQQRLDDLFTFIDYVKPNPNDSRTNIDNRYSEISFEYYQVANEISQLKNDIPQVEAFSDNAKQSLDVVINDFEVIKEISEKTEEQKEEFDRLEAEMIQAQELYNGSVSYLAQLRNSLSGKLSRLTTLKRDIDQNKNEILKGQQHFSEIFSLFDGDQNNGEYPVWKIEIGSYIAEVSATDIDLEKATAAYDLANAKSESLKQSFSKIDILSDDTKELLSYYNPRSYEFCTDGNVSLNNDCNRFDEGTNLSEIVDYWIQRYIDGFETSNTRNGRTNFYEDHIINYAARRLNQQNQMRDVIEDYDLYKSITDNNIDGYADFCGRELAKQPLEISQGFASFCGRLLAVNDSAVKVGEFLLELASMPDHTCELKGTDITGAEKYFTMPLSELFGDLNYRALPKGYPAPLSCFDQGMQQALKANDLNKSIGFDALEVGDDFDTGYRAVDVVSETGRYLNGFRNNDPSHKFSNDRSVLGTWVDRVFAIETLARRASLRPTTDEGTSALTDIPEIKAGFNEFARYITLGGSSTNGVKFTDAQGNPVTPKAQYSYDGLQKIAEPLSYWSESLISRLGLNDFSKTEVTKALLNKVWYGADVTGSWRSDWAEEARGLVNMVSSRYYDQQNEELDALTLTHDGFVYQATADNRIAYEIIQNQFWNKQLTRLSTGGVNFEAILDTKTFADENYQQLALASWKVMDTTGTDNNDLYQLAEFIFTYGMDNIRSQIGLVFQIGNFSADYSTWFATDRDRDAFWEAMRIVESAESLGDLELLFDQITDQKIDIVSKLESADEATIEAYQVNYNALSLYISGELAPLSAKQLNVLPLLPRR